MSSCTDITKIRFYVDGLNFYYGIARPYQLKWIDIEKLLLELLNQAFPLFLIRRLRIFFCLPRMLKIKMILFGDRKYIFPAYASIPIQ